MSLQRLFVLLLCLIVSKAVAAEELGSDCDFIISGSQEAHFRQTFANWAKNYNDGILTRGYMGNAIPNNPLSNRLALEYGLIYWGMTIRLVPTIEAAQLHRKKVLNYHTEKGTLHTDKIVTALYILGDETELNLQFDSEGVGAHRKPADPEIVRKLLARGGFEINENGEVTNYSPEQLARRISPTEFDYNNVAHLSSTGKMNSISQSGWVVFKQHGIHDFTTWKERESYKKIEKLALELLDRGFVFRFNFDPVASLKMLADQPRTYSEDEKNEEGEVLKVRRTHDSSMNRYAKAEIFDTALGRLQNGEGYTAELYDSDGELAGGEIGFVHGNHYYGDSVFYNSQKYKNKKLDGFEAQDLAKAAGALAMKYMFDHGQPFMDPGMITPYTASMGAGLVPFPEYLAKIKSGPREPILLPPTMDIRTEETWRERFAEIAKRRDRAFTSQKLLTQLPLPNSPLADLSSEYNLVRKPLRVVFVPTLEAAQADVAQYTSASDLPLYLIGNFTSDRISELTGALTQAVYFKNSRHPEHVLDVPLKRARELVSVNAEDVKPEPNRSWTTLLVSVWAYQ